MTETFKQQEAQPETITDQTENTTEVSGLEEIPSDLTEDLSGEAQVSVTSNSQVEENWEQQSQANPEVSSSEPEVIVDLAGDQSSDSELEQVISILQQDVTSLKSQLDQQVQQTDSFKGQYMRLAADFENFRRRTSKEKDELEYQIKKNTVTELLGAIDSFERARSQIKPGTDGEMAIHKSYQGVYKQLVDGLKRLGVSAMRPEGEEFDPNYHEAVFREPTNEHPEGTVLEQLVRGYFLHDKVLRHAMVKVAAPKEDVEEEETPNSEVVAQEQENPTNS